MTPSKKHNETAQKLMKRDNKDQCFVNEKGEFFYHENSAALSVSGNKKKYAKIKREAADEQAGPSGDPDDSWTVKKLKAHMEENSIEFDDSDKKADLLDKIKASEAPE